MRLYEHKCINCGKKFETKKKNAKFCSRSCTAKHGNSKNTKEIVCQWCGERFIGYPNRKYCNKECSRKANNKTSEKVITCQWCGKEFSTRHHKTQRFCSQKCGNLQKTKDGTTKKVCKKCGKEFYVKKSRNNKYNVTYCSLKCSDNIKSSSYEFEIINHLKEIGIKDIIHGYRPQWMQGKEIDIFLPNENIGIEFNGVYWHSEQAGKGKFYHRNKSKTCFENGVRLIHVFEDDWVNKKLLIINRIHNLTVNSIPIYARKCEIKNINNKESKDFINKYHTQGNVGSTAKFGLFYEGELVSVLTFGKQRIALGSHAKEGTYEIMRYCSNKRVVGGFRKLLSRFVKEYNPKKIITYMDMGWNFDLENNIYAKSKFKLEKQTDPSYWYVGKDMIREHRFKYRKSELIKMGKDKTKSEREIMEDMGYWRIYNCGSAKFSYTFTSD